jgi:hypothetical protein
MGLLFFVFLYLFFAKFNFLCSSRTLFILNTPFYGPKYIYTYIIYICVVYHISSHLQPWFLGTTSSWRHARHIRSHSQDWAWTPRLLYPQRLQRHASMIQQVSACSVINLSPNKSNAKLGVVYEFYYIMNSTNIAFLGVEPPFTAIYTMFNRLGPPQWEKKHGVWLKIIPSHCGWWIGISVSLWIVITNKHQ